MSEENVEVVRRLYEAVGRGDRATVLDLYASDVEIDGSRTPLPRMVGGDGFQGHEALKTFFRERAEAWEEIEDRCEELIDAGLADGNDRELGGHEKSIGQNQRQHREQAHADAQDTAFHRGPPR